MATLNRIALTAAMVLFTALAVFWTWRRFQPDPSVHFDPARFAVLDPPASAPDERWVVAVNPACPHCREHLADLAHAVAGTPEHTRIAALVVDTEQRPDTLALGALAPAGVWWDSAQVWRREWGHGVYGEVLHFTGGGALRATHPPGWRP
jgi:hypothetical protein